MSTGAVLQRRVQSSRRRRDDPGWAAATGIEFNLQVAARLEELASLLREQDAEPFRPAAYSRAAGVVRALSESVQDLYAREGLYGLERLPAVGPVIAHAIRDCILSGTIPMLERLRGERDPAHVLETVWPGSDRYLHAACATSRRSTPWRSWRWRHTTALWRAMPGFGAKRVRERTAGDGGN